MVTVLATKMTWLGKVASCPLGTCTYMSSEHEYRWTSNVICAQANRTKYMYGTCSPVRKSHVEHITTDPQAACIHRCNHGPFQKHALPYNVINL